MEKKIKVYDLRVACGHKVIESFDTVDEAMLWIDKKPIKEQFNFLVDIEF